MSVPAWLRRPGRPYSAPESSCVVDRCFGSRRRVCPESEAPSSRDGTADRRHVALHFRRALASALLCLSLLAALSPEAAAQTRILTINAESEAIQEGETAYFQVTWDEPAPSGGHTAFVVRFSGNATNTQGVSYQVSSGQRTSRISRPTSDDNEINIDRLVTATLIAVTEGSSFTYIVGDPGSASVTVRDDDGTANSAPTVANAIPDRPAVAGTAFSYQFAATTFSDADGDSLTYSATQDDGTALPTWLSFTASSRTFSGTPPAGDTGTVTVRVTANDNNGGTVSDDFDIVVSTANSAPTVANAIPDRPAVAGTAFSYQFAATTFSDADGDSLTYSATQDDGTALPTWLSFTASSRTFSGTPPAGDTGTVTVRVTANDNNGGTVSDDFDIVVSVPGAPNIFWSNTVGANYLEGAKFAGFVQPTKTVTSALTVSYTLGGTATAGTDYTIAPGMGGGTVDYIARTGTFVIPAGTAGFATYTAFTLTAIDDNIPDPGETVVLTLVDGTDYNLGSPSSLTRTVLEDGGSASFSVSGVARVGEVMTATKTADDPDGNGDGGFIYQWQSSATTDDANFVSITGATELTYTPEASDVGRYLRLSVFYNDAIGVSHTLYSTVFGPVVAPADPVTTTGGVTPPVITAAGVTLSQSGLTLTEGGNGSYSVRLDTDPGTGVTVTVTPTSPDTGTATVSPASLSFTGGSGGNWATPQNFTVSAVEDGDSADESVNISHATTASGSAAPYHNIPTGNVAVTVTDNDAAGVTLSQSGLTLTEGGNGSYSVRLDTDPGTGVTVTVTPTSPDTGAATVSPASLSFTGGSGGNWATPQNFTVSAVEDGDSADESVNISHATTASGSAAPYHNIPTGNVAVTVTDIENSDPLPAAYLARFGRTVAEQALDGIAGRMSADRTPGMQGTIAGQSLRFDPSASGQPAANGAMPGSSATMPADREAALAMAGIARGLGADASAPGSASAGPGSAADPFGAGFGDSRFGTPSLQSRSMTARDALLGSSFSLTGQKDGAGGSLAFWGRASQASFDGAERGDGTDIGLDGTVTTGMLGADYARGKWLVGLALTQSSSEGSYAAIGGDPCPDTDGDLCDGAVRAGDGDVEASLKVAIPYAALQVSERLKLWGAAGYGTGEVTLKTMEESYKADTSWTMAAAGVRGDLLEAPKEGSGPALALTSDALWARTSSDKTGDLAATDSDATRLRLGLEGSYRLALEGEASLTPKLEIGARHDGGDAETGFGVEIGGGIAWVDPGLGLSLDVSGRTLLAHENDDLKDRGVSASLAFDPAPATRRGPSFSLRQDFGGQAQGGLDALFAPAPLEDRTGSEATSRWAMEAAYGFPAFGGRFTGSPHVGLGLSTGARDYSVGWRLAPEAATAPDLSFGLRTTRRESDTQAAGHTVGFEITARW